jgi:serine/threonine protein kinase
MTLDRGWVVDSMILKTGSQTGGHFSCSYRVQNAQGKSAFLKAMDYTRALAAPDPAAMLNAMTSAFLFERQLLQECSDRKMTRVVKAIDEGKVFVAGSVVEYMIFELASGDVRSHLDASNAFDLTWTLSCIHNICLGMQQLNGADIAHQDLKPSNVLVFDADGEKLADLGRAWHKQRISPHDDLDCAGDLGYAPPELLYGHLEPVETDRRYGADFYLLGSMILFLFTGMRASAMLISELDPAHRPRAWKGTYAEVLPYLAHAFNANLATVKGFFPDATLGSEIVGIVKQMCDPNIVSRGDRLHKAKHGSRFSVQRFISHFDRLRVAALIGKIKHP